MYGENMYAAFFMLQEHYQGEDRYSYYSLVVYPVNRIAEDGVNSNLFYHQRIHP